MKYISNEEYARILSLLIKSIERHTYWSGSIHDDLGTGVEYRLSASLIVYRDANKIINLTPVAWEFHWYQYGREVNTDFCFSGLNNIL